MPSARPSQLPHRPQDRTTLNLSQNPVNPRMDFCKDHSTVDSIQRKGQNLIKSYLYVPFVFGGYHVVLKPITFQCNILSAKKELGINVMWSIE